MVPCLLQPHLSEWSLHVSVCFVKFHRVDSLSIPCIKKRLACKLVQILMFWLELVIFILNGKFLVFTVGERCHFLQQADEDPLCLGGKGGKLACPLAKLLSENSLLLDTAYSYQGCPCLTPNYAIKKLATSFGCIQPCAFWYLLINCPVSSWKEPWGWSYCSDLLHTWKDTGNKEKRLMYCKHAWELDFFRRHKKAEKMLKILEHRVAT